MSKVKNHTIPDTHHVFAGGRTGSGKTELLKAYTAGYPYSMVLDTKGEFTWGDYVPKDEVRIITSLDDLPNVDEPRIIWRPEPKDQIIQLYSDFFYQAYEWENICVIVDEAMSVSPNPHVIPEGYKACLTRGRSKHVPVWSASQRPAQISQIILSEATHFFIYNLNIEADRKKLYTITGQEEMLERPGTYKFWYYDVGQEDDKAIKARLILPS